ncbi:MAG: ATP-binding cassette domain-containing protein [Lentisphaerae bacterium]|nr:ATP-binding cassette domain-containing protein [Lentisphaerota bacterium]
MLQVSHLQKRFGNIIAVDDVSFQVGKGEVLGFLGPNGAGKTTTMRMITGFLPPTAGTAQVAGHDILRAAVAAKKEIGYLPENAPLYDDMSVWDYLAFSAAVRGYRGRERQRRLEHTIALCRLETVRHQNIGTLSKGYRQRTCLAQALLHDPPLLIMDEPTDGLDPNQKQVVRRLITEMAARKAIVISTHILEEVEAVCTRAIIICQGRIVANGAPADLKKQSRTYGAVELTLASQPGALLGELEHLPAAAAVEARGQRVLVYARDPQRLFPEVMALLQAHADWPVIGLQALEGRLDDVFQDLTQARNNNR